MSEIKLRPKISDDQLTLSGDRIFFSIQGEGPSIGQAAVFLRLHLCNLSCSWCDTPYTWDERGSAYWTEWKQESVENVAQTIRSYNCNLLVITGGEPLLQQKAIALLLELLPKFRIEIETNGTLSPLESLHKRCHFNVSPKLANSLQASEKCIRPQILRQFNENCSSIFKFVVSNPEDLKQIQEIARACNIDPSRIIIMPEGTQSEKIDYGMKSLAVVCRDAGYRLLPRLHVQIWGNQRGV